MDKVSDEQIKRDKKYVIRVLEWFDRKKGSSGNYLLGKEELTNFDLNDFREILNINGFFDPDGDVPYDHEEDPHVHYDYEVIEGYVKKLQPFIEHRIDMNKYLYYISSYART